MSRGREGHVERKEKKVKGEGKKGRKKKKKDFSLGLEGFVL